MGCVSFTTKAKDTNTAAMQTAMTIWPGMVSFAFVVKLTQPIEYRR